MFCFNDKVYNQIYFLADMPNLDRSISYIGDFLFPYLGQLDSASETLKIYLLDELKEVTDCKIRNYRLSKRQLIAQNYMNSRNSNGVRRPN